MKKLIIGNVVKWKATEKQSKSICPGDTGDPEDDLDGCVSDE